MQPWWWPVPVREIQRPGPFPVTAACCVSECTHPARYVPRRSLIGPTPRREESAACGATCGAGYAAVWEDATARQARPRRALRMIVEHRPHHTWGHAHAVRSRAVTCAWPRRRALSRSIACMHGRRASAMREASSSLISVLLAGHPYALDGYSAWLVTSHAWHVSCAGTSVRPCWTVQAPGSDGDDGWHGARR